MTPSKPASQRVRFGSAPGFFTPTGVLSSLEQRPLVELLVKDVMAFNIPKISMARTMKEREDTAILEFSNTAVTLFSSLLVPPLLRKLLAKPFGVPSEALANEWASPQLAALKAKWSPARLNQVKLARLGVAFAFFFPFAMAFWAAPFFRNWLTLKRNPDANFESLIGFGDMGAKTQSQRTSEQEKAYQSGMAFKLFGAGVGLSAATVLGLRQMIRSLEPAALQASRSAWGNLTDYWTKGAGRSRFFRFFENFDLKGKQVNQIASGRATLIFWGLPAYLGWVHAARSGHERRERIMQSVNAIFWFFYAGKLTGFLWNSHFLKKAGDPALWKSAFVEKVRAGATAGSKEAQSLFQNKVTALTYEEIQNGLKPEHQALRQELLKLKNWKFALNGLGVPIVSLGLVQLLNFNWTERKIKAQAAATAPGQGKPALQPAMAPVADKLAMWRSPVLPGTWPMEGTVATGAGVVWAGPKLPAQAPPSWASPWPGASVTLAVPPGWPKPAVQPTGTALPQ